MTFSKITGKKFEAIVHAQQRIRIVHILLALVGSFSLWKGSLPPHFNVFARGMGLEMTLFSALGWAPYLFSWLYSRSILDGSSKGVGVFTIGAIVIAAGGFALYQNLFGIQRPPSPILISAAVTVALLGLGKICSMIFPQTGLDSNRRWPV